MRTKVITEFASSWNGDLDLMEAMIKSVSENGGDLCKLQDYRAKNVPDNDSDKTRYEKYEMKDEYYPQFLKWCNEYNVEPLVTCFNKDRVKFLAGLGLKKVKIASISMTNTELLMEAGANFEELIVSTAFQSKEKIEETIDLLSTNAQKFTIMACVGNYPLNPQDANLNRIDELKEMTEEIEQASVGYSDHSLDLTVSGIAMSKGIKYLEKHFSLSRYLPQTPHQMYEGGPLITTHQVSIEPNELQELSVLRDAIEVINGGNEFKTNEIEQKIKTRYAERYGK